MYFLEALHTCTQLRVILCVAYVYVVRKSSNEYPLVHSHVLIRVMAGATPQEFKSPLQAKHEVDFMGYN